MLGNKIIVLLLLSIFFTCTCHAQNTSRSLSEIEQKRCASDCDGVGTAVVEPYDYFGEKAFRIIITNGCLTKKVISFDYMTNGEWRTSPKQDDANPGESKKFYFPTTMRAVSNYRWKLSTVNISKCKNVWNVVMTNKKKLE